MTDQEIKEAILKTIDKNKVLGHINIYELSKHCEVDEKKILSLRRQLVNEGLLKHRVMGKMVLTTDFKITEKGRQYLDNLLKNH